MAMALVGGMIVSTLLTLFVVCPRPTAPDDLVTWNALASAAPASPSPPSPRRSVEPTLVSIALTLPSRLDRTA